MRIPVTQADWPSAFNEISKYLGRHWPLGKLKLTKSQELTAKLFGYTSVFDARQSITSTIRQQGLSISKYAKSMSLRALIETGCPPDVSYTLFCKLPWKVLEVFRENEEISLSEIAIEGDLFDQLQQVRSYKSSDELLALFDESIIPPYKYAVKEGGLIYRRDRFLKLLKTLDIEDEDLDDIEYMGTKSRFYREQFERHIWEPIKDVFVGPDTDNPPPPELGFRDTYNFPLPHKVVIEELDNGRYQLFNSGLQALYPGDYDIDQLKSAITTLFNGEKICNSDTYKKAVCLRKIEFSDQKIYLNDILRPYEMIARSKWLSGWQWPSMGDYNPKISELIFDQSIEYDCQRIERWGDLCLECEDESQNAQTIMDAGSDSIAEALKVIFGDEKITGKQLHELGSPEIEDFMFEDASDEETQECQEEFNKVLNEIISLGSDIRKDLPELGGFFDDAAISLLFEEWLTETPHNVNYQDLFSYRDECYVDFITFVARHLHKEDFRQNDFAHNLWVQFIADVIKKRIKPDDIQSELKAGLSMVALHDIQWRVIRNMQDYRSFLDNQDSAYLTHGKGLDPEYF